MTCWLTSWLLRFREKEDAEKWTEVRDFHDTAAGTGLSVYRNRLGGTVAVSAFALDREASNWSLNFERQTMIQNLMRHLCGEEAPVMARGGPYVFPIHVRDEGREVIAVFNLCADNVRPVVDTGGEAEWRGAVIAPLCAPKRIELGVRRGVVQPHEGTRIPYLGCLVLERI